MKLYFIILGLIIAFMLVIQIHDSNTLEDISEHVNDIYDNTCHLCYRKNILDSYDT
jgi:hypothetical protein